MRVVNCPICGKAFVIAPKNIYKALIGGKVKHLCGWNCLRVLEKEREANKDAKKRRKEG